MYKIIFLTPCKKPSACRGIPSTLDSVNKLGSETAGSATSNTARKHTLPSLSTSGAPPLAGDNVAPKTESQRLKMTNEEFKQVLGLENMRKQVYLDFRSAIQFFMSENEVVSRRQAGEEKWGVVKDWVLCHSHLKQVRQRLREESIDWASVEQAIHFFCLSCSKSLGASRRVSENTVGDSEGRLTDPVSLPPLPPPPATIPIPPVATPAMPEETAAWITAPATPQVSSTGNQVKGKAPATPPVEIVSRASIPNAGGIPAAFGENIIPRWIQVSLCDPDLSDQYAEKTATHSPWGGPGVGKAYLVMLNQASYADLFRACSKKVPDSRAIQEIWGATCLLSTSDASDLREVSLSDDEEVVGWLVHSEHVTPLQVLVVLSKTPRQIKVGSRRPQL